MSNLYNLIDKIHQKPGLYLGAPSLSSLYMFLCGYSFCRQEQGIAMSAEEKEFEKFQNWIQQRFSISASVSWAKIILLYSTDERSGFEMFFKLWSEFRGEQQKEIFDRAENDAQNRIDPQSKHHRQEIDCIITVHQSDVG